MAQVTRRTMIKNTATGAAALGVLAVGSQLPIVSAAAHSADASQAAREIQGPLVAHVRDIASGEVAVMVGTREYIIHDRQLVLRLVKATR